MFKIKIIVINLLIFLIILIGVDFFYTQYTNKFHERNYRIKHNIYHHTLAANVDTKGIWGKKKYKICTDEHGFKSNCLQRNSSGTDFDIAFIGDSFTEAIGIEFKDSFVGLFAEMNPNLKIVNLAVSSYSPSIYYAKVKNILESGIYFDHLVVFVDISDIFDEAVSYKLIDNIVTDNVNLVGIRKKQKFKKTKNFFIKNLSLTTYLYRFIKNISNYKSTSVFSRKKSKWTYDTNITDYGKGGPSVGIKLAINHMIKLDELLKSKNIKLSVGVYPWPAQLMHDDLIFNKHVEMWKNFCIHRCLNFINTFPYFEQKVKKLGVLKVYKQYYLDEDIHYNKEGNKFVFQILNDQW